jgi:signal peptidase II
MKIINPTFWFVAIVSLLIDIVSKQLIVRHLSLYQSIPIVPNIFHITYVRNNGAAFSLFQGHDWLRWLSLVVTLFLIWFGSTKFLKQPWEQLGLGAILAGAAGNGIDRLQFGSVVDFIDLRIINFAVFNWADICINVGLFCLLVHTFKFDDKSKS